MTDADRCPTCGSTNIRQDQIEVTNMGSGGRREFIGGLKECLDCADRIRRGLPLERKPSEEP